VTTKAGGGNGVPLGLRANAAQFVLLVALNALVGAIVGLERSVLPLVGEREFGIASKAAVLSFVVAFGLAKALTNLGAGRFAERVGRKRLLVLGWLLALPIAPIVALAPSWEWIVGANVLLGVNQGLAWSLTALMKIDLAGAARRGLALGLNESAGYLGLAATAAATGILAASFAPRTIVWSGAAALALTGLLVTVAFVRDTAPQARAEQERHVPADGRPGVIRACAQAGFATNLNDALAWGLVPLYLAANGADATEIGLVAGTYPAVWGAGQLATGWLSDRTGRKPLIVAGMLAQAAALALLAASSGAFGLALAASIFLGLGTALAYPTLIAAVADAVAPLARPRAVGVYRFWRDSGLVAGGLAAGFLADALGTEPAIVVVAALTAASGLWVATTRWNANSRSIDGSDDPHRQLPLDRGSRSAYARVR
jgi:MFS family permease